MFVTDFAIKKETLYQLQFFDIRRFKFPQFTLKFGSRGTPLVSYIIENRIFPSFLVIEDPITPEILVEKVWFFDEY